jgi:hypothetical protein
MKKSVVVLFLLMGTFLNAEDKTANGAATNRTRKSLNTCKPKTPMPMA